MKPVQSFRDHPQTLYLDQKQTIYLLGQCFYLASEDALQEIVIMSLMYTNMGEPFRQLARVEYTSLGGGGSLDVSAKDAALLYTETRFLRGSPVFLDPNLQRLRTFEYALKALENSP